MARVTKINVGGTNYDIAHEGALKNSWFEVVTSLPTTDLFGGRMVTYRNSIYFYDGTEWVKITKDTELSLVANTGNYIDLNGLPEHLNFYNIPNADKIGSVEETTHHCGTHPGVLAKLNNQTFYPTIDISDEGTISWDFSTLSSSDTLSLLIIGSSLDKGTDAYDALQSQINRNTLEINNILNNLPSGPSIVDRSEELYSYGIEKDFRLNLSTCTRVGNLSLHRTLPIQSGMKGCLLDDDGNIVGYLPQNDWTTATRDGSKGQVMVHIPAHYRKFYTKDEGNIIGVRISLYPIEGYHYVPDMFIGAYEAALDRVNNKLCSVVNDSPDFRGGSNQSDWDNTYRSLLGRPCTNKSRIDYQTYARNRGSMYWNSYLYQCHQTLCWLYVIEYADFNCQLPYNGQLTSSGYHQGGLGAGVSNLYSSEWTGFNSQLPFVHCGYTDSLGNNTGTIDYTLYNANNTILKTTSVPRYRGIENPFGHIWKILEGINIIVSADVANGGNGLSKVYVCDDLTKFSNTSVDDYTYIGNESRIGEFIKTLIFGENGCIIPSSTGGTSTYPIGDYHYTVIPSSGESLRIMIAGGDSKLNVNEGLFYLSSDLIPSYASIRIGSRLCYVKNNLKIETL